MELAPFLDQLHARFHQPGLLYSDPLEFPHQYADPWDREAVAVRAALLAYGRVKQIRASIADALARMGTVSTSPSDFVRSLEDPARAARAARAFKGWVHRFNSGRDLMILFRLLARSWREHGSLGAHFLGYLEPDAADISDALSALVAEWRKWSGTRRDHSFQYLLTSPADGSCCKRWCMLLRWMGRDDGMDLGLWSRASKLAETFPAGRRLRADQLVMPLDTHTGRISQYLGLTRRKSLGWLAAREVTASLRQCDAADPARYDFALARLGILDLCQKRFRVEICRNCELLPACRFARKRL
jgi:uncharacterized protein (TIGR02757 family)